MDIYSATDAALERIARAIYDKRPYKVAERRSAFDDGEMHSRTVDYDSAPAFYINSCWEMAMVAFNAMQEFRAAEIAAHQIAIPASPLSRGGE